METTRLNINLAQILMSLLLIASTSFAESNEVKRIVGETYNDTTIIQKPSAQDSLEEKVKPGELKILIRKDQKSLGINQHAFDHKVFFVDRPAPGDMWDVYYRNTDFIGSELGLDLKYVRIDLITAGFKALEIKNNDGSINTLTDYFTNFTLSSKEFQPNWIGDYHKLSLGMKVYKEYFKNQPEDGPKERLELHEANSLFISQSFSWDEGVEAGLYFSRGGEEETTDVMWVPWVQGQMGHSNWFLGGEYYYTNLKTLPLRFLQYGLDVDKLEFYNPSREWVSWMNYGVKYAGENFYFSFSLMNHYSFEGPILPMVSLGYEF